MNWEEGISLLGALKPAGEKPGLERIQSLMRLLGDPQKELSFVHIAGTNGKGSAAAMISQILTAAGYRTGRFISPHLVRINERYSIDGEEISDDAYSRYAEMIADACAELGGSPSLFERLTAISFLYFHDAGCDVVVLEVGLGGRFDATNVIDRSLVSLIMHLGLEHTELLGNTIEKIAFEKAGIIKNGGFVVLQDQEERAVRTIREICRERGAALTVTSENELSCEDDENCTGSPLPRLRISYRRRAGMLLGLRGAFQVSNAAVVLDAVDILICRHGFRIPEEAVVSGLSSAQWPGRFDIIHTDPLMILDGAHNPDGCRALAKSLRHRLTGRNVILVMGVMADKNVRQMLEIILHGCENADPVISINKLIAAAPAGARSLAPEKLAEIAAECGIDAAAAASVQEGVTLALDLARKAGRDTVAVAFGSLYLAGEILGFMPF